MSGMRLIPKGSQTVAGGRRPPVRDSTPSRILKGCQRFRLWAETRFWHPFRMRRVAFWIPGVSAALQPPATVCDRFAIVLCRNCQSVGSRVIAAAMSYAIAPTRRWGITPIRACVIAAARADCPVISAGFSRFRVLKDRCCPAQIAAQNRILVIFANSQRTTSEHVDRFLRTAIHIRRT